MDSLVYPQEAGTWLHETELCLFKVEVPMAAMSSAKSNKKLEEKAMKTANQASQGSVVKYGQQVQLRHVHSGGHLSLALCTAAKEPGAFTIEVSKVKADHLNVVTLQPDSKLQKVGEPIKYWDKVEIVFQEGNLKHYLHLHGSKTQQDCAIIGSLQSSAWNFNCFEDVNMGDETFKCGSLVQVQLVNSVLHLSQKGELPNLRGDENDYGGFWIAEREVNTFGGPIHFGEVFYLKNARSGLYLSSDLQLSPTPRPSSAIYLPKPESFRSHAEVNYNLPVILCFPNGGKLASAVTERKEEIMYEIVPHGSSESREELVLEADLGLDMTQGKDVLFQVDQMNPVDAIFLMQMAKLVPKLEAFQEEMERFLAKRDAREEPEFMNQVRLLEAALHKASDLITQSIDPDTYERRQSIVVGMGVHKVLISIAYAVFRAGTLQGASASLLQQMVRSIWGFLIEVASDNEFASAQVERQKEPICDMVVTEKHLIGTLLSEIYRIVDPEMPNYAADFKEWCDKLESLREDNVLEQTVFIRLIRCLCEVGENVKVEYQKAIASQLFGSDPFPMVRMIKTQNSYYVQFYSKPAGLSCEQFAAANPALTLDEELTSQENAPCVNLEIIMKLPQYIEYLANVLLLINTLCKGQFEIGRTIAGQQGLNSDLLMGFLQWSQLHLKMREVSLLLMDSLFISCSPYKSTLQSKKENFCYSFAQLADRHEYFLWNPLETEKPQTKEVRICLHLTLSIWMQRETPSYFRNCQKVYILNYLSAVLRVAYSLLDFDHCSHMYARCISRGLAFLLLGMRDTRDDAPRKHWGVTLMQSAVKEMHRSMDIRVQMNDIFRMLVHLLTGVMCFTRQNQLAKLASACCKPNFDKMMFERSEELLALIDQINDPLEGVQALKRMLDKSQTSSFGSEEGGDRCELNTQLTFRYSREIVLRGPETKEALFRVMLTWKSISSSLKDTLITLLKQSYDSKAMLSKFLRNVDIISDEGILAHYETLKTYSQMYNLEQLALDCKFEMRTGNSATLEKLCMVMERVTNFVNLRSGQPLYVLDKLQNVMRHLSWHKRIMALWPVLLYLGRMQKSEAAEQSLLRLSTLTVCFLINFCRGNPRNRAELLALFQTDYYDLKVPQYAELIREISGFELLTIDVAQRLVTFLLDNLEAAHSSVFLNTLMFTRAGTPREDIQNLVARLVSEHVSHEISPEMLKTLSLACLNNSCAAVLCRSIRPVDAIEDMADCTSSPLMLEALLEFLYCAHVRTSAELPPTLGDTAAFMRLLQQIIVVLHPIFSCELDLVDCARRGLVDQAYPKANPTIVDEMRALGLKDVTRNLLSLFSGVKGSGATGLVPQLLNSLYDRPHLALPTLKQFKAKIVAYDRHLQDLELKHTDFDFSQLRHAIAACGESINSFIERHEMKPDKLTMIVMVARKLARTMKRNKREDCTGFENFNVDQRLKQLVALYDLHSSRKEEDYLEELAKVFLSMVFPDEIPLKIPREIIDTMVRMLNKMKRVFAGTHHRNLYFTFLQHLVPRVEREQDLKRKYVFNQVFLRAGVIEEAVLAATDSQTLGESNAALEYLNALLEEQSKQFQDQFRDLLDSGEKSYYLFVRFKLELEQVKVRVLEEVATSNRNARSMLRSLDQVLSEGPDTTKMTELLDEGVSGKEQFLINSLIFLQLCCDNCNMDSQNYIRSQRKQAGLADIDLVSEVANLVMDLTSTGNFVKENQATCQILVKSFAALLDFVTGPCPGNQVVLGNNVPLFLSINKLLSITLFEVSKRANKIHGKICIFLHTLLEGESDVSVYQTMVRFLDLKLLRESIERFYKDQISGCEEDFRLELDSLDPLVTSKLKIMLLQAIFLLKLKNFQKQHPELKRFSSRGLDQPDAYNFYIRYIGYVEVDKGGVIQSHYFPIPFKCKFLTTSSRDEMIREVNRNSHQKMIEDFMSRVDVYMREMKHQQQLSRSRTLKQVTSKWQFFARLSFFCVLLTNLQLLFTFSDSIEESMDNSLNLLAIRAMGVLQLTLYIVSFAFNTLEYFPNKISKGPLFIGAEIDRYPRFPHNDSQYIRLLFDELQAGPKQSESLESQLREIGSKLDVYYNYIYFLVSIVAVYWPLFSSILLLDIIKQNQELINVLKSVTVNMRQLLITLCLGMIIIFLFGVYSFVFYQEYYQADGGLFCHDVLDCFTSTLNIGVRSGGGIGDGLAPPDHSGSEYWSRMSYDMLFYLVIIIVLLNIIFGIIIDTFALLRNQRSFVLEDINTRCYVCGTERSEIELHGKGWSYHFMVEHSPLAYLAFLVYLREMPIVDCAGIEKFVKEKLEKRDYTFMPNSSKLLQTKLQRLDSKN